MSDDLVKRLRQSWDADRSIMSQTERWMAEREAAADRIEELEAEIADLKAKLAKAVEALDGVMVGGNHLATILPDNFPPIGNRATHCIRDNGIWI